MKEINEEFIELLNEYWLVATTCYDQILTFMETEFYIPKGRIPNSNFSYEHHGLGYTILLDSGIQFDFDFDLNVVAGFKPHLVAKYLEQVKEKYPALSELSKNEFAEIFKNFEKAGQMDKHPYKSLYNFRRG